MIVDFSRPPVKGVGMVRMRTEPDWGCREAPTSLLRHWSRAGRPGSRHSQRKSRSSEWKATGSESCGLVGRAGRAGRVRGKGTCAAVSTILRGSCSGGGFAGRTATAAGSGWTCWRSQECSAQSLSRVLCCTLCLTSKEDPAGVTQEEHLLLLGNKTTAWILLDICTCWFVSLGSIRLSLPTSGLARRRRRRVALPWRGVWFFIFHSVASPSEAKLC